MVRVRVTLRVIVSERVRVSVMVSVSVSKVPAWNDFPLIISG